MSAKMRFERYEIPGLVARPAWWQVRNEEIIAAAKGARKGQAFEIARSVYDFPVYAVAYGPPRATPGTATWASASSSWRRARTFAASPGPGSSSWPPSTACWWCPA